MIIARCRDDELHFLICSYNLFVELKKYSDAYLLEKKSSNTMRSLLMLVDNLWERLTKNNNMTDLKMFKLKFENEGGYDMFESI